MSGGKKATHNCREEEPERYVQQKKLYKRLSRLSFHLSLSRSRCYNKTNGTFSSGTLPVMHRVAPCQQDGLEMVPLGQVSSQCHGPDSHLLSGDPGADAGGQPDEHRESSPSQHSCCLVGNNDNCPADNTGETHFLFFFTECPRHLSKYFVSFPPPTLFFLFLPFFLLVFSHCRDTENCNSSLTFWCYAFEISYLIKNNL